MREREIEVMRSLMNLTQAMDKTTRELRTRAMKLSTMTFPEEIRENATIRVQPVDLFVNALENERIRHDANKEALIRLSVSINLAKDSENVWEKTRNCGTRIQDREELGSRMEERDPLCGRRKDKLEDLEKEYVPNRRTWSLGYEFYKPTPGLSDRG